MKMKEIPKMIEGLFPTSKCCRSEFGNVPVPGASHASMVSRCRKFPIS